MSDTSPVIQNEEGARVLFLTLKVVASFGVDSEVATRKREMARAEAASKDLRR